MMYGVAMTRVVVRKEGSGTEREGETSRSQGKIVM
jgi:hypothetical protein